MDASLGKSMSLKRQRGGSFLANIQESLFLA